MASIPLSGMPELFCASQLSGVLLMETFRFFPRTIYIIFMYRNTWFNSIEIYDLIQYYMNWWHKNVQRKGAIVCMKTKGECSG